MYYLVLRNIVYNGFFLLILLFSYCQSDAQTLQASRRTDWSRAGLKDTIAGYSTVINIMSYGGVADGITSNDTAYLNALSALSNKPGVIFFPAGSYKFQHPLNLKDSTVIAGEGIASKFLFDMGGAAENMININGLNDTGVWQVNQPISKNDTNIYLNTTSGINVGDWLCLYGNDTALITSGWAYKTVGQIFQVVNIYSNKIITDQPLRRNYDIAFNGKLKRIIPIKRAGVECVYIERVDSTAAQTSNIDFVNAVNCWMIGVESYYTNFSHVEIDYSSHITIRGNYMHHSHGYGGNGQGYGTTVEYTSGDCLIENNIFEHLRHSMLIQAGANGNVFAYNYSKDPFWNEPSLPANAAGDAVCHGNYPYMNLFEGNILNNIVIDNSHGINGPFNTFFRNRAELYGIIQNSSPATDSMNYIGNEVTNTGPFMGNYILAGNGYFEYGNTIKTVITPVGTSMLPEHSLFLTTVPGYWTSSASYPNIGTPYAYNVGNNSAKIRYTAGATADCRKNPKFIPDAVSTLLKEANTITFYPNPARQNIFISSTTDIHNIEVMNNVGQVIFKNIYHSKNITINIESLTNGFYFVRINGTKTVCVVKNDN